MVQAERASRDEALDLVTATLLGQTSRLTRLLMGPGSRELTRTEAGLLTTLTDGPRRITELAETEALAQPSVSKLVDRLEARHLVARQRTTQDGRGVLVAISEEGRQRLDATRQQIRTLLRQTLLELEEEDLAALVAASAVLDRLIQMLQWESKHP